MSVRLRALWTDGPLYNGTFEKPNARPTAGKQARQRPSPPPHPVSHVIGGLGWGYRESERFHLWAIAATDSAKDCAKTWGQNPKTRLFFPPLFLLCYDHTVLYVLSLIGWRLLVAEEEDARCKPASPGAFNGGKRGNLFRADKPERGQGRDRARTYATLIPLPHWPKGEWASPKEPPSTTVLQLLAVQCCQHGVTSIGEIIIYFRSFTWAWS